jgi:hypothetical protein
VQILLGLLLALTTTTPSVAGPMSNSAVTTPAAAIEKVPVFLHVDAEDTVGATYVDKLRAALETSTGYRAVKNATDAQFVIGIVTMDPSEAEPGAGAGRSTVAAVTLQLQNANGLNYMVYSWVLVANRERVDSLVGDLFTAIDKEIKELRPANHPAP